MELIKVNKNNIIVQFLLNYVSDNTRLAYKRDICDFFSFLHTQQIEIQHPKDISLEHLIVYREYLGKIKKLTSNTIHRKIMSIKSLFNWCASQGIITHNPVSALQLPKASPEKPTQALADEEALALLKAPDPSTFYGNLHQITLSFLLLLGLRRSELANIQIKDIYHDRGHLVLRIRGKGGKTRELPLTDSMRLQIMKYKTNYTKLTGFELFPEDYLLQSKACIKNKTPITGEAINKTVKKYSKKLNINKDISAHSCRATVISSLLEKNESPRNVADFAGHSSINTTVTIYDKKRDNLDNSSAYKVNYKN